MIQARTEMIAIIDIKVSDRARTEMGSVGELCTSIQKFGLLNPIIIDQYMNLHCGERRLRAFKELKLEFIPCRFIENLSEVEKLEVELDENIRRKELTWTEELFLKEKITRKWQELEPKTTLETIASRLNMSDDVLKTDLFLVKSCKDNPELQTEKEKTAALRKAREIQNIAIRNLMVQASGAVKSVPTLPNLEQTNSELSQTPVYTNQYTKDNITIYNDDCLNILKAIQTESVDCIISDPPYGVDFDGNSDFQNWLSTFRDDHEFVFTTLLPPILTELYRVLKPDGVLFGGKDGGRRLTQPASTVQSYQNPTNKLHPAEKPVSLLEYYITQSTIEGEVVLDCFAGSGSTILAAFNQNRVGIGIEKEKQWFDVAVTRFL